MTTAPSLIGIGQVSDYLPDYLRSLERIVNIDSDTYNKPGIDLVAAELRVLMETASLDTQVFDSPDWGLTLVGRKKGKGTSRILLVGHMDTVFPLGTVRSRPFRVSGSRAYGPGVTDMKGGLLLGLFALRVLERFDLAPFSEAVLICNGDEEVGSPHSRSIIEKMAGTADVAFILEAARISGAIVSGRKGVGMYEIGVRGRPAHAGIEPERGASAVLELAHKIVEIRSIEKRYHGVSLNVGTVTGGTRPNVVPEQATAKIDVRVPSADLALEIDSLLKALATRSFVDGTETQVIGGLNRPPFEPNDKTERLVHMAKQIAEELGFELSDEYTGAGSDGNFTAGMGIATLDGLGPVGGHAHSEDEFLEIPSIEPRLALLANLMVRSAQVLLTGQIGSESDRRTV